MISTAEMRRGSIRRRSPLPSLRIMATTFLMALITLLPRDHTAEGFTTAMNIRKQQQEENSSESIAPESDPEAALRFGYHLLRSNIEGSDRETVLDRFDTLTSGSGFSTGETLFLLGRAHDEGREDIGIRRDEAAALEMYSHAAKLGHPQAQHALSVLLATSAEKGGEVEAILYDFFASLGGDPLAHAALGYRYLYGIGTVQDCAQSLLHYQMAARETIADLHSEGRGGIPRSIDGTRLTEYFVGGRRPISDSNSEVVDLLEAAADVGDIISIRKMGMWHQHGDRGIEQNLEKAHEYFDRGVKMLDLVSTSLAGNLLMRGAGVEADYAKALSHFTKSQASPMSLHGLGFLHYHGLGVERDITKAHHYFETALKEDGRNINTDTLFYLGMIHQEDTVVDESGDPTPIMFVSESGEEIAALRGRELALKFFVAAATLGHVEAAYHASLLYADSDPLTVGKCQASVSFMKVAVERGPWMEAMRTALHRATAGDYGGALVLYSRLAELGSELAQSNAAWLLESGHCDGASFNGTKVDCEKRALRLYEHAAEQGQASAEMKVGDFHYYGKADLVVDYEKAARRYHTASEMKHAEALFGMGFMHQMGRGVPQDLFLAKRYFDDAALASVDAIPVARLSLFLLRIQSTWMSLRTWWRSIQGETIGGSSGDESDASLPAWETLFLVGLILLLAVVMLEQGRRQRASGRRRRAAT